MPPVHKALPSNQEDRIIWAIEAIKQGHITSIRAAATSYDVPYSSLFDRMNGMPSQRDTTPNSCKLTLYEESALV
ncbi:hypothetical protein V500_03989 [Pseudogymnoascus sp. VKM F-4518 (FW-2643)]|nr:hypothetical protein V500_03989 [Pseudogymnoascus sp. VKM F-4518 (FW-2643)]